MVKDIKIGDIVFGVYPGIVEGEMYLSTVKGKVKELSKTYVTVKAVEYDDFFEKVGMQTFIPENLFGTFDEAEKARIEFIVNYYNDKIKNRELLIEDRKREIKELEEKINYYQIEIRRATTRKISRLFK